MTYLLFFPQMALSSQLAVAYLLLVRRPGYPQYDQSTFRFWNPGHSPGGLASRRLVLIPVAGTGIGAQPRMKVQESTGGLSCPKFGGGPGQRKRMGRQHRRSVPSIRVNDSSATARESSPPRRLVRSMAIRLRTAPLDVTELSGSVRRRHGSGWDALGGLDVVGNKAGPLRPISRH